MQGDINPHAVMRTAGAFFCNYLVSGVLGPFISPTLLHLGYTHTQAGLIVACSALCTMGIPMWVGRVSDSYLSLGRMLRGSCAMAWFMSLLFWSQAHDAVFLVVTLILLNISRAPLGSLLDTLAMQVAHNTAGIYSRIRLMGSLGFMAAATVGGLLMGVGREERFFLR